MTPVKIRNVIIGQGRPKICLPIVGKSKDEIVAEAKSFSTLPVDVVEWRVDWFDHAFYFEKVCDVLTELRSALGTTPLLMTFRTSAEGGEKTIDPDDYAALNIMAAKTGLVDLIDVELFMGDDLVSRIINEAHDANVFVVASNHDFQKTPAKEEIVSRLRKMQHLGADIPKIAVMPNCKKDVITLLSATEEMASNYATGPIITMSMSGTGVISRLCGETFGSALTFGAAKKASAPGQVNINDLALLLDKLHDVF